MPDRLCSPNTIFLRQRGHSFELAIALCSLLLGLGLDAYVVSGYASQDVSLKTMCRIDSPYPPEVDTPEIQQEDDQEKKYVMKQPRDLRSKFLLMMEQREKDKIREAEEKAIDDEKKRKLKEEEPPLDELEGLRVHGWVLLLADGKDVEKSVFIEPSTGMVHDFSTTAYSGIESVWNQFNYWVNMQDCTSGLAAIDYDLTNVNNWEHLLIGEPIHSRKLGESTIGMDEDDLLRVKTYDEKHLDMPISWSARIGISHEALTQKYPGGSKKSYYKRCIVQEYAPYVQEDGLVTEITRFKDFDCTDIDTLELKYENRADKLYKTLSDNNTGWVSHYFHHGRDDNVIKYEYQQDEKGSIIQRVIEFNFHARHDGLWKIEIKPQFMAVHYKEREDKLYYRDVSFAIKGSPPPGVIEGHRRIILKIIEKFECNESIPASEDIAVREFDIIGRVINLKFHYGPGKVTASTRQFIKPPVSEMGDRLKYHPDLTSGYQAEIDAKPPRKLKLFLLLQKQLEEEEVATKAIRDIEDQVEEFFIQRDREIAFPKLEVSLFNREQNTEHRAGMLEREKQQRELREKEVEEETDYLVPQLARLGKPNRLAYEQAVKVRHNTLEDFKQMLLNRANDLQKQFETNLDKMQARKQWYLINQDLIPQDVEVRYFEEIHDLTLLLRTLEIRLIRHRDLSGPRYQAMVNYLNMHPMLRILHRQ